MWIDADITNTIKVIDMLQLCYRLLNNAIQRGDIMDYKREIIKLLQKIEDERLLRYVYILLIEMIAKK